MRVLIMLVVLIFGSGGMAQGWQRDWTFGSSGGELVRPATTPSTPGALAWQDGHLLLLTPEADGVVILERFTPDGRPDSTFASGGVWRSPVTDDTWGSVLMTLPDGALIVVQYGKHSVIRQLTKYGLNDAGFGQGGSVSLGFRVNAVALDAQGRLLLAGGQVSGITGAYHWAAARLLPNGRKDGSFDGGFIKPYAEIPGMISSVVVLPDGGIVLGGTRRLIDNPGESRYDRVQVPWLARLTQGGTLDKTFTVTGFWAGNIPGEGEISALYFTPDGVLIAAGNSLGNRLILVRVPLKGGEVVRLTAEQAYGEAPQILPGPDQQLTVVGCLTYQDECSSAWSAPLEGSWPQLSGPRRSEEEKWEWWWKVVGGTLDDQGNLYLLMDHGESQIAPPRVVVRRYKKT